MHLCKYAFILSLIIMLSNRSAFGQLFALIQQLSNRFGLSQSADSLVVELFYHQLGHYRYFGLQISDLLSELLQRVVVKLLRL